MNTLRTIKFIILATLAVWVLGCSDDTTKPPPPDAPPQIDLNLVKNLRDNDVYGIFVDSQSRQWFCTNGGLGMAESQTAVVEKWFDDFDGIPNRQTRAAVELHGKIYVATWGGGIGVGDEEAIYFPNDPPDPNRPDSTLWTILDEDSGLIANRVFDLAVDDSSLWIATPAGISQYVADESRPMANRWIDHSSLGSNVVTSIVFQETSRGPEIWMSEKLRDSLGTYLPGGIRVIGFPGYQHYTVETSGIPDNDCNQVVYDPNNDLFLSVYATFGAASVDVDTRTWDYFTKTEGLVSNLGSSIAVNSTGKIWDAGTIWYASQAGLSKINPNGKITNFIEGSGMPTTNVRQVYIARNDEVWVSFVEGGAGRVRK